MKKIISIFLAVLLPLISCGCSRESKMGIDEFLSRIKKDYSVEIDESTLSLEETDEKKVVYCRISNFLCVFYLGTGNNISGIAVMADGETDNENITAELIESYAKCAAVFTMQSEDEIKTVLSERGITADKIKFTDSNLLFTVGKFEYTVVADTEYITLFCRRV